MGSGSFTATAILSLFFFRLKLLVTDSAFDMGRRGKNVGGLGSFLMNMHGQLEYGIAGGEERGAPQGT